MTRFRKILGLTELLTNNNISAGFPPPPCPRQPVLDQSGDRGHGQEADRHEGEDEAEDEADEGHVAEDVEQVEERPEHRVKVLPAHFDKFV